MVLRLAAKLSGVLEVPRPPNCPRIYLNLPLFRSIRAPLKGHWWVLVKRGVEDEGPPCESLRAGKLSPAATRFRAELIPSFGV